MYIPWLLFHGPVCFLPHPSYSFSKWSRHAERALIAGLLWQVGLRCFCVASAEPGLLCPTPEGQVSHRIATSWPSQFIWLSSHQPWPAGMGQALLAQQPTVLISLSPQGRELIEELLELEVPWVSPAGYWLEIQLYSVSSHLTLVVMNLGAAPKLGCFCVHF